MKFAQNFSILYWIRKNAGTKGKSPIYCRLTLNGQRTEIAVGLSVEEKNFNKSSGFVKGASNEARTTNAQLDDIRGRIRKIYLDLLDKNSVVTTEMIREVFVGKVAKQTTVIEAIQWHNDMFLQKVNAGVRAKATWIKFSSTQDKVKGFIKWHFKITDLPLANVKPDFGDSFEHYLAVIDKLQHNSVMKHMRNLKKVFIMAEQKQWIARNPMAGNKCSYQNPERNILLQSDIDKLLNTKLEIKRLEEVRDCFVFMCYTGFAFQDAANLSPADIQLKIDGKRWLVKPRIKTGNNETVPILPIPEAIIDKYKSHPYCVANNRLLPFNSNQKMNAYLKEVGAICKLNFDLTTHLARHTFATTITLANGVPLETVQVLLGHQSIKTTQIYAKVVAQKISDDMEVLKRKLNPIPIKKRITK